VETGAPPPRWAWLGLEEDGVKRLVLEEPSIADVNAASINRSIASIKSRPNDQRFPLNSV
jgi:hypothetical protein